MAVTATQTIALTNDIDGDGVFDPGDPIAGTPGDTVTVTTTITNTGPGDANNVAFSQVLSEMTETAGGVHVTPIAFNDGAGLYNAIGNVTLAIAAPSGVLANDIDANASTPLTNAGLTAISLNTAGTQGTVTLNADGSFSFTPTTGFSGTTTFQYTAHDAEGLNSNQTGTVTVTVGPVVWFIDDNAAPGGDGSQANPFNSIAAFNAVNDGVGNRPAAGDIVYLASGTYTEADGINLLDGQNLVGAGSPLVVTPAGGGGPVTLVAAGTAPTIIVTGAGAHGIDLGHDNAVSGLNVQTNLASQVGIDDGGHSVTTTGTLNISGVSVSGVGQGIDIDQGGNINVALNSVSSSGSSTEGIQLAGISGSFSAATVSISGSAGDGVDLDGNTATVAINGGSIGSGNDPAGIGVDINGGNANVTISASIAKTTAGDVVEVTGRTGGTVDFNGNISSTSGGIDINANAGGTVRFDGGMSLSTGATTAFNANGNTGTTLVVTDTPTTSNILATTTGTALNVVNTSIGGEDLTFQSISSAGAASGIVLNNTGTAAGNGGLTITGTGSTDGSGGVITGSTGAGINLTSTKDVNISNLNVASGGDDGIRGSNVNGFTLANVNITNNGNAVTERGIDMTQLSGSGGISDSTISGSAETNVRIENDTANLTAFNVTNTTFATPNFTTGDDGMLVLNTGSAAMNVSVTGSTFTDNKGDHFQAATDADATGTMNITFNNNTLTTTAGNDPNVIGGGVTISTSGASDVTFQINNNNIQQAFDDGININLGTASQAGATLNGTISGNTIGTAGQDDSGSESSNAITIRATGQGDVAIAVTNNTINEWGNGSGISLETAEGSPDVNATITGNTIKNGGTFALNGIRVDAGATSGPPADSGLVEVTISGNDVTNSMPGVAGAGTDIRVLQTIATTVKLPG